MMSDSSLNLESMQNCTRKVSTMQPYLYIKCSNGYEWMDYGLPTPQPFFNADGTISLLWWIDNSVDTKKSRAFMADIQTRLSITLNGQIATIPPLADITPANNVIGLKSFSKQLKSIKDPSWRKHLDVLSLLERSDTRPENERLNVDRLFDVMRFAAYDYVKAHGKGGLTLEYIQGIGMQSKDDFGKARSDVKSKAKAIFYWVMEYYAISGQYSNMTKEQKARHVKEWRHLQKLKRGEQIMTRSEAATKATAVKQERTKAKIQGAINVLRLYGKKITAEAVAEEAKIARGTAQKYVKQLKEEGVI